ncbi:MAG TPA: hypothetical protein VJ767_11320 [Nitrososphaeraceae archaeon]|nr:hypothetical protein [Nitrososphaeraceae archaeon]
MKCRINYYALGGKLCIISFLTMSLMIFSSADAFAPTESNIDNENEEKDSSISSKLTTIKTKLDLNNITNIENYDRIKVVGYLNGEGQISFLDLEDNQKEIQRQQQPNKNLNVDLKFNQTNYISSVMVDDEYFVCAYMLGNNQMDKTNLPIYDCDEGNIGLSTDSDTVTLFSTMKKYSESNAFYKTRQNSVNDKIPERTKITINVPVYDAKDIEDMYVVGMIKGDYQIKTINVQDELNKGSENQKISVPLIFDRQTESGPIQPGDMFFGCATSDEFLNQNSDCEKRILKNLNGLNSICARKDNSC